MPNLVFRPIEMGLIQSGDSQIAQVCESMLSLYKKVGYEPPWIGYLAFNVAGNCVGTCAFKSPPENGKVEIAYFTFPPYEKSGVATEMTKYLILVAKKSNRNLLVFAQTLPEENASNHILKNLSFEFAGEIISPEDGLVWEWNLLQQTT